MKNILKLAVCWYACAGLLNGQAGSKPANPLHRQYREGEKLAYHMKGINEAWHFEIDAEGVVTKDAAGRFFEELQWTNMRSDGQPAAMAASATGYRQRLTLDPDVNPSPPDLSKVDPRLIGPITDMMTFYVDLWLANKIGALRKAGDHFYFRNPMPASSWADGSHTILGESAIDFDMTLKSVDAGKGVAVLAVRHVPPEASAIHLPADWMEIPVGSRPNNWVGVTRQQGGFEAAVGEEMFEVEIT